MLDFMRISVRHKKDNEVEIYPKFMIKKSSDLMIRGGDFYAIWLEKNGLWSTDEDDALTLIDSELRSFYRTYKDDHPEEVIRTLYIRDSESGVIDKWHKYCQKQMRDSFQQLDENLIFSNMPTQKEDFGTKKLPYPLKKGDHKSYDELISTLYSEENRRKIEWAIGSIITGDSKTIQKFMVLYGAAGTGKSTIINIIQQLFEGYYSVFDAKALGSSNNSFALEAFKNNPLVAIQHDGDLSKIEDNTRLNSLVSHELMTVNEKFKTTYANRFKCFLIMGTNKPVKITDAKSGLIRRLIDVEPTGKKIGARRYKELVHDISYELGAIAFHCKEVYLSDPHRYDNYIPTLMMGASNDFYNFVVDSYSLFLRQDSTTLKAAWAMYQTYCEEARVPYPYSQRAFKEELKNYFWDFSTEAIDEDGHKIRNKYSGFRKDRFEEVDDKEKENNTNWIELKSIPSLFDREYADCPAQEATSMDIPGMKWDDVKTKLRDINTQKVHYVRPPDNHIVIDFDIKDETGNKSFNKNLEAANKWPKTYAELSKSGAGIHLHYIYTGDVTQLNRLYDENIEIKVFTGKSSIRRKLTQCNDIPIATISSGLPLKEVKKTLNFEGFKNEKALRTMIERNLKKEIHPNTKPSVDFIFKNLEDAYNSGMVYDVSDLKNKVLAFAAQSTHQSDACIKMVGKMKFKSEEKETSADCIDKPILFFDVEVFPNLFLICWKAIGEGKPVIRMYNPSPQEIEELLQYRLIGYNCRRYDNHMLYAGLLGYSNEQIFSLSQKIINAKKGENQNYFFREAYNISYTDVYDFASAGNKMSLKKLEIEMGIHHQELGLPWDEPVPKELWDKVGLYCDNDVLATEAAFNYLSADWTARQILADLAGMSVNDTTNSLTTRIIFGNEKKPQSKFNYRNLAEPVLSLDDETRTFLEEACPKMMSDRHGEAKSLLPYFPGYKYENGVSTYRGEKVGEGGYVYSEPGIYINVALLDVASEHPHSAIAEVLFGVQYTKAFRDIVEGRVSIKHEAWEEVNHMLDGKLTPYIQKVIDGEITSKQLADALKTAINSVYGLTSAGFDNAFRDIRNKDNIVAKRGALFMIDLKYAVQNKGYRVAHIKTDSIKIPDATPDIIQFVIDFGKKYGYTFEHEATYDRMCLVNDAVYIARYKDADDCKALYDYIPGDCKKKGGQWTATGTQFAVPYVFKTLFSKEKIEFEDLCETKSVTTSLYLDRNERLPDVSAEEQRLEKIISTAKKSGINLDISGNSGDGELDSIIKRIAEGHNYIFIGKVGQFCPIKPGCGGGLLMREKDGKYYAVTGSKGYRWLESEMVRELKKEGDIDLSYYDNLVNEAVDTISKYGDFEWFVSNESAISPWFAAEAPFGTEIPWEEIAI